MALGFFGSAMATDSKYREGAKQAGLDRLARATNASAGLMNYDDLVLNNLTQPPTREVKPKAGLDIPTPKRNIKDVDTSVNLEPYEYYQSGINFGKTVTPIGGGDLTPFSNKQVMTIENQDEVIQGIKDHNQQVADMENSILKNLPFLGEGLKRVPVPERIPVTDEEKLNYFKAQPYSEENQAKIDALSQKIRGQKTLDGSISTNTIIDTIADKAETSKKDTKRTILERVTEASRDTQIALRARKLAVDNVRRKEYLVKLEYMYGNPETAKTLETELQAEIKGVQLVDNTVKQLQGEQAVLDFNNGNTARGNALWSDAIKRNVVVIPRDDNNFDVEMDGQLVHENIDVTELTNKFRLQTDRPYRELRIKLQQERNKLVFENKLAMLKDAAMTQQELAKIMAEAGAKVRVDDTGNGVIVTFGQQSYVLEKSRAIGPDGEEIKGKYRYTYVPVDTQGVNTGNAYQTAAGE